MRKAGELVTRRLRKTIIIVLWFKHQN